MDVIACHHQADWDAVGCLVLARKLYPQATLVLPAAFDGEIKQSDYKALLTWLRLRRLEEIDTKKMKRLVLVGTRQKANLGNLVELADAAKVDLHIYDNHRPGSDDVEGSLEVIRDSGACTTILVELLQERDLRASADEATWALLGIYQATGNLLFPNTKPEDLRAAAWLIEQGARMELVGQQWSQLTKEQIFLLHDMLQAASRLRMYQNDIAWVEVSVPKRIRRADACLERLLRIQGGQFAFALLVEKKKICVYARSATDQLDIGSFMSSLGGSGDKTSGRVIINSATINETRKKLLAELRKRLQPHITAKDLMVIPAKSASGEQTVAETRLLFNRSHAQVLPVVDQQQHVLGLVDHHTVERACQHDLTDLSVADIIGDESATCEPDTDLSTLQRLAITSGQSIIPVVKDGKFAGIVMLDDVLRSYQLPTDDDPFHEQNLAAKLKKALPQELLDALDEISRFTGSANIKTYIVGGFVRDLLLGLPNVDLDLVVEGDAVKLAQDLSKAISAKVVAHEEFRTATLILDDYQIDLAMAREEHYEQPGSLPVVQPADIRADLARRDFTINTMLIRLDGKHFGRFSDWHHGQADLKAARLRVLHGLSFIEDPTRIFRMIRFKHRLGFTIDDNAYRLIKSAVSRGFVNRLAGSRIFKELSPIFHELEPSAVLKELHGLGLFSPLHEDYAWDKKLDLRTYRLEEIIQWQKRKLPDKSINYELLWLATLVGELDEKQQRSWGDRLDLAESTTKQMMEYIPQAKKLATQLTAMPVGQPPSLVAEKIRGYDAEVLMLACVFSVRDDVSRPIKLFLTQWQKVSSLISGRDLEKLGLEPGPAYSEILAAVRDARLDGEVNTKSEEIDLAKDLWQHKKGQNQKD